ncbi:thioredoxin [Candidatus Woesearchaeota archaeon]|nr:thioredoxin [Candidatus Woesearchaeota archaeon]
MVKELNKENFEKEALESDIPVVVDFWASWCGPCRMMEPVFEKLSADFEGKLKFAKLSTEENPELAEKYGIRSIPCLKMFKGGKEVSEIIGFKAEDALKAEIENALEKLS